MFRCISTLSGSETTCSMSTASCVRSPDTACCALRITRRARLLETWFWLRYFRRVANCLDWLPPMMWSCVRLEVSTLTMMHAAIKAKTQTATTYRRSRGWAGVTSSIPPVNCVRDQCKLIKYCVETGALPYGVWSTHEGPSKLATPMPHQMQPSTCAMAKTNTRSLVMLRMKKSLSDWIRSVMEAMISCMRTSRSNRTTRTTRKLRASLVMCTWLLVASAIMPQSVPTMNTSSTNHVLR
mmetsp:Transcript_99128/g.276029  ORF Transcript_99128/g.276029 Transcript_99128/m.276029 type:complete len:239 (-) Transcript_99128:1269-1985(-)